MSIEKVGKMPRIVQTNHPIVLDSVGVGYGHDAILEEREKLVGDDTVECPTCGGEYQKVGMHWSQSDCEYPSFTRKQWDILVGLLLGDGSVDYNGTPCLSVEVVNRRYLQSIKKEFPMLMTGIRTTRTAEESYEDSVGRSHGIWDADDYEQVRENYHDKYVLSSRSHPDLQILADWYESGEKEFPDGLKLNPTVVKHWYAGDGCMDIANGRCTISSRNESGRGWYLERLFDDIGMESNYSGHSLTFSADESRKFLEYVGRAPPGFEYKWETNRGRYDRLKELSYRKG